MKKTRPVNLDLASLNYPPMAIASILHRISGIILFLSMPFIIFIFDKLTKSEHSFTKMIAKLSQPGYKMIMWLFCAAIIFHLCAGIRHLLMDVGFGEDLDTGRRSAWIVLILSVILTLFLGMWIW